MSLPSTANPSSCELWTDNRLKGCSTNHGIVAEDGLRFSYRGSRSAGNRVALASSMAGWRTTGTGIKYFEITIANRGSRGYIAIGLVPDNYDQNSQPGWRTNSVGYHADDSGVFLGSSGGHASTIPPRWDQNGAVTGCGIDYDNRRIFFTREGVRQRREVSMLNVPILYPAIGLHSESEQVTVNFGSNLFAYELANQYSVIT